MTAPAPASTRPPSRSERSMLLRWISVVLALGVFSAVMVNTEEEAEAFVGPVLVYSGTQVVADLIAIALVEAITGHEWDGGDEVTFTRPFGQVCARLGACPQPAPLHPATGAPMLDFPVKISCEDEECGYVNTDDYELVNDGSDWTLRLSDDWLEDHGFERVGYDWTEALEPDLDWTLYESAAFGINAGAVVMTPEMARSGPHTVTSLGLSNSGSLSGFERLDWTLDFTIQVPAGFSYANGTTNSYNILAQWDSTSGGEWVIVIYDTGEIEFRGSSGGWWVGGTLYHALPVMGPALVRGGAPVHLTLIHTAATKSFVVYVNGLFGASLAASTAHHDVVSNNTNNFYLNGCATGANCLTNSGLNIPIGAYFPVALTGAQIAALALALSDSTGIEEIMPVPSTPPTVHTTSTILPTPSVPTTLSTTPYPTGPMTTTITVPAPSTDPATGNDVRTLGNRIGDFFQGLLDGLRGAIGWLGDIFREAIKWLSQQIQGFIQWLGDKLAALLDWIGAVLVWFLTQAVNLLQGIIDAVLQVVGLLISLPQLIASAISAALELALEVVLEPILEWMVDVLIAPLVQVLLDGLELLFVPGTLTMPEGCSTSFPCNWIIEVHDTISVAGAGMSGDLGDVCGPSVGFTHEWGTWTAKLPAPSSCGGNGPGGSRLSSDDTAYSLFGYRTLARAVFSVMLWLTFAAWFVRQVPGFRDEPMPGAEALA